MPIAADDLRHGAASAGEAVLFQRRSDAFDMFVKAALGDQRACNNRDDRETERHERKPALDGVDGGRRQRNDHESGDVSRRAALGAGACVAVERIVERLDQPAEPHHRMADGPQHRSGIAECCFDQQGQ